MLSFRTAELSQQFTVELADKIRAIESQGNQVIKFNVGDINLKTPKSIREAAYRAMNEGETKYSHSRGLPALRKCIAEFYHPRYDSDIDPESQILVSVGAINSFFSTCAALLNNGDEVLCPDPAWATYRGIVAFCGGTPVAYPSPMDASDTKLDYDTLKSLINEKTKMIVLGTPGNPTGYELTPKEIDVAHEIAKDHDLWLVLDDIYANVRYTDSSPPMLQKLGSFSRKLILISGFSKCFAMTGWRLGYSIGPPEFINEALKASQHCITNVSTFSQYGAIDAMKSYPKVCQPIIGELKGRALILVAEMNRHDLPVDMPNAGLYIFPSIARFHTNPLDFANDLLNDYHTAVVPGCVYGKRGIERIRISFGNVTKKEIPAGVEMIAECLSRA
ncbi:MAG: pyridoxal phosphate-dependent aminotransferase [Candidatus Thorarchaeota archaeon]|nr:pyridoxal phosphate-dependent aminotransferase [Candidatus Thorarchaeota archaeon]